MDKKKLYTLSLKFERHNLHFDYNEESGYIVIGKAKNVRKKIVQGVALLLVSIPLLLLLMFIDFPLKRLFTYLIMAPIAFGFVEIYKSLKLAKANKFRKIITQDGFKFESAEGVKEYPKEHIDKIELEVRRDGELEGEGELYFSTHQDEKVRLVSLKSKKVSDLKIDLQYLKDFLDELLAVKTV